MLAKGIFILILLCGSISIMGQKKDPPCNYNNKITINGNLEDWNSLPNQFYSSSIEASFDVASDSDHVFIALRFNTDMQQMKVLMGGMELYIDSKAKKSTKQSIYFPIPESNSQMSMKPDNENRDPKSRIKMINQIIQKKNIIKLEGFGSKFDGTTYMADNPYVHVSLSLDSTGCLIYEAAIQKSILSNFLNQQIFSIGIKINALNRPDSPQMGGGGMPPPDGMGGGPPMGNGGPPLGNKGGDMPNFGEMEQLFETDKEWIKAKWCY